MRPWFILCLLSFCTLAGAQVGERFDLFRTVKPDLTMVVRKHDMGADLVEVSMIQAGYPPELLRQQIAKLGEYLGSQPRGVNVFNHDLQPGNANMRFLKASFAVDGLVNRTTGALGLGAIAKAFAGAPAANTIDALSIQYESEVPSPKIVQQWRSDAVELQGQSHPLYGLEFRIKLLSQDPNQIRIPEGAEAQKEKTPPPAKASEAPNWLIIGLIALTALALGALVYSLLLRPKPRLRSK